MLGKLRGLGRVARRYAGLIGLTGVAAVLLGAATVVPASAHGMVDSGRITNQTIRSVDISAGGVAGSEIRQQSIKSWDIDRGSVATSEVRNQSLRSVDISAEGVGTSEIRDGSVRDEDLAEGVGDGPQGPPGEDGEDGQDGVSGYEVDGFYKSVTANGQIATVTANCAAGKYALGGGYSVEFDRDLQHVTAFVASNFADFEPIQGDPEGSVKAKAWEVRVQLDDSGATFNVRPWVACAAVN